MPCWEVRRVGLDLKGITTQDLKAALDAEGYTTRMNGKTLNFTNKAGQGGSFYGGRLEVDEVSMGTSIRKTLTRYQFKKNATHLGWKVRTNVKGQLQAVKRKY